MIAFTADSAQAIEKIELIVPVKLDNMLPEAKYARVVCQVKDKNDQVIGGQTTLALVAPGMPWNENANAIGLDGSLDKNITILVRIHDGESAVFATKYRCALYITTVGNNPYGYLPGTSNSTPIWRRALSSKPFRRDIEGPLQFLPMGPDASKTSAPALPGYIPGTIQ